MTERSDVSEIAVPMLPRNSGLRAASGPVGRPPLPDAESAISFEKEFETAISGRSEQSRVPSRDDRIEQVMERDEEINDKEDRETVTGQTILALNLAPTMPPNVSFESRAPAEGTGGKFIAERPLKVGRARCELDEATSSLELFGATRDAREEPCSDTTGQFSHRSVRHPTVAEVLSAETHRAPEPTVRVMSERSISTLAAFQSLPSPWQVKLPEPSGGHRDSGPSNEDRSVPPMASDELGPRMVGQSDSAASGLENSSTSEDAGDNETAGRRGVEIEVKASGPSVIASSEPPSPFSAVSNQVYDVIANAVAEHETGLGPPAERLGAQINIVRNLDVVLHPSECGAVQLRMSMRPGAIGVEVLASSAETARAIGDDKADLRRRLRDAGMDLTYLTVDVVPEGMNSSRDIGQRSAHSATTNSPSDVRDFGSGTQRFNDEQQRRGEFSAQDERSKDAPTKRSAAQNRRLLGSETDRKWLYV